MPGLYALFLLCSIAGLATLDRRFKFAVFYRPSQAFTTLAIAIVVFITWDIAGILLNIFRIGENNLLLGLNVGEFPVEELLFLILLNYTSLIVYCAFRRRAETV